MIYLFPKLYMDLEPTCSHFRFVVHNPKSKTAWDVTPVRQLMPGVWVQAHPTFRDHPCNFKKAA